MAAFTPIHQQTYFHPQHQQASMHTDDYTHEYGADDDDSSSILDDSILDHSSSALDSGLEMSPPMLGGCGSRRDSFAVSSSMFSPKQEEWTPLDPRTGHRGGFVRSDSAVFNPLGSAWPYHSATGLSTPMQTTPNGGSMAFDLQASMFQQRPVTATTPFGTPYQTASLFSSTTNSSPASPEEKWSVPDPRSMMPRRTNNNSMRPHSPTLRSHGDITRRDGIRKKNARFEIPAERNLANIDHMIAASTDDSEIKELKQQKRLLRNRQAALDSRQRKKMHTERLEDEKKQYTSVISELEEELAEARCALEKFVAKEPQWEGLVMQLQHDKEELLRAHTIESGDLRRKVGILSEHVRQLEHSNAAMVVAPTTVQQSNTFGQHDDFTMDGLTMDHTAWDNISFLPTDFAPALETDIVNVKMEQQQHQQHQQHQQQAVMSSTKKNDTAVDSNTEKPATQAQGLLLMLLLVGAFVAAKGATSVPKMMMSDDVRAASATLLQDVFKDAGVQDAGAASVQQVQGVAPLPSGAGGSWSHGPVAQSNLMNEGNGGNGGSTSTSSLGALIDHLSHPSADQLAHQAFSLSAAQYGSISEDHSDQDFTSTTPTPPVSSGRRNLTEALAAMRRANSKNSAAEVYTRSLLWDQVPREVVRDFARLVAESEGENQRADGGSGSAMV